MALVSQDGSRPVSLVLDEREKELVRRIGTVMHYRKGDTIWSEGDVANRVYLIEKGYVKIYHLTPEGRRVTVGSIRNPGEMMGLAETLYHGERTCYAGAMTDVTLVAVTKQKFLELLTDEHHLSLKVSRLLAARMREAESMVRELVCWQVPGRLALMLLKISERCGVPEEGGVRIKLRLTHEEIANMIGATRQTVTALLNTFRQERSIEIGEEREIKILDPQKLANWVV